MSEPVRILLVEDLPTDAELAEREIKQVLAMCVFQRVETHADYLAALEVFQPDLIISDFSLPRFDGLTALRLALAHAPLAPVIILTGAINEDTAVECMQAGAVDYVIKEHIKRLGQAVIHALEQKGLREARRQADDALRASEERYRTLAQTLPDAVTVTNDAGIITYVSPSALRFYGYDSAEEVLGHSIFEWVPPDAHQRALDHMRIVLAGETITNQEYLLLKKDGSSFFGEVSASCLKDGQGYAIGMIIVVRDISERKRAEEAQAKLEEQLRQAQKLESIGRLAGGVAHDFNNLLTVIQGYCDLIQSELPIGDPMVADVDQIRLAGERASALTRQLLAFSRKQILAPSALDLNDLITNLRKMLERLIGEDITLSTMLQAGLWQITADPGQIEQLLMNLVVNARDAMPTGGLLTIETANIHLDDSYASTHIEAPLGPCVMLAVTDTGQGMDAETQAHIFEPFFTTKEPGKGTGLGLSTVYGITKQSGGHIMLYSEPGRGASFKIYLPASAPTSGHAVSALPQPVAYGGTETILLAEDEQSVRHLVRIALLANGYTVLDARHGGEALALASQHQGPIDLVVTDVVMPEMGGRELVEQLKAGNPRLKVLFMSGYTDDTVVRHGLLTSEIEYLPKPFSLNTLVAKVREVLDK
jgi:PAS domain S-box-containing protein